MAFRKVRTLIAGTVFLLTITIWLFQGGGGGLLFEDNGLPTYRAKYNQHGIESINNDDDFDPGRTAVTHGGDDAGDNGSPLMSPGGHFQAYVPHRKIKQWKKLPPRFPVKTMHVLPTEIPVAGRIPRVQAAALGDGKEESAAAKKTRLARRDAVRESFLHSWQGYKKHAWMHDEVRPVTGDQSDPFGGWAATLVDALDTLWIMGLRDEFDEAVKACEDIDFTTTQAELVNIFETVIRYLGGFLAAYELSGKKYPVLLRKAVQVADLVMCAVSLAV